MEQVVQNVLRHDGMRYLKLMGDGDAQFRKFLPRLMPEACARCEWSFSADEGLGIVTVELTWPVFEPYAIWYDSPKKFRRMMAVNFSYASRVSDVIKLAVDGFCERTLGFPKFAYVRQLPKGAEDGMDVHGVVLIESEIAPGNCVLIGGMA